MICFISLFCFVLCCVVLRVCLFVCLFVCVCLCLFVCFLFVFLFVFVCALCVLCCVGVVVVVVVDQQDSTIVIILKHVMMCAERCFAFVEVPKLFSFASSANHQTTCFGHRPTLVSENFHTRLMPSATCIIMDHRHQQKSWEHPASPRRKPSTGSYQGPIVHQRSGMVDLETGCWVLVVHCRMKRNTCPKYQPPAPD